MKMRISRRVWFCVIIIVVAALVGVTQLYKSLVPATSQPVIGHEELDSEYFSAVDEAGKLIFTTGHMVVVGDEYIDEDNIKYVVKEIKGNTALLETIGPMENCLVTRCCAAGSRRFRGGARNLPHSLVRSRMNLPI